MIVKGCEYMFTRYEDFELLELFWSEAESLTGSVGDGEVSYTRKLENGFELTLFIHAYRLKCGVFVLYNDEDIFSATLTNVLSIEKSEKTLIFKDENKEIASIYFGNIFKVRVNDME